MVLYYGYLPLFSWLSYIDSYLIIGIEVYLSEMDKDASIVCSDPQKLDFYFRVT